jgi:hypothetical protein
LEEDNKQESSEETKEEQTASTPTIDAANAAAERMEKATAEMREQNKIRLEAEARERLGGMTNAGGAMPQKTEEEKKIEGAKEFFKGTALEKAISTMHQ